MRYLIIAVIAYHIIGAIAWLFTEHKPAKTIKQIEAEHRQILREQERLAKAQEREEKARIAAEEKLVKEQEKQAAQLAKHEEMIRKLEMRMATAESELAFNREQRERLFKLLDIEERERDAAIEGSRTWQAHHKKVISLENQIHTVQKRIDRAHMDKAYCESKLSA